MNTTSRSPRTSACRKAGDEHEDGRRALREGPQAVHLQGEHRRIRRLLDTELANRERAKHDRLLRRARFPVVKGLDGYDFTNVRLPDGYMLDELLGLGFIPRAQDLVFYGKTGRGKSVLAIGLGM